MGAKANRSARAVRGAGGFTLFELMMVVTVLAVAFVALSQSLVESLELNRENRESALAMDGIAETVEILQGTGDFDTVFARFNSDPSDDPALGPSPGSGFAVPGLEPVAGDADGLVGEIVFPTTGSGAGLELHEDVFDPDLGMPRDLDGSGFVEAGVNQEDEYVVLPVLVRLEWQGSHGRRTAEIRTILADR